MKRLVCLHGFTGTPDAWDAVLEALPASIEARCPAIVGHGPGVPLTGTCFEDEVDRLASALPRSDGPFHLAGYSLGGRLALGLLTRHQELFASATLIGVHPGLPTDRERRERTAADDQLARKLEREGVERFVDFWQSLPLFATQEALPQELLEAQRRRRLGHRIVGLSYALRNLSLGRMPDYRLELPRFDVPVHLMLGERDEKFRPLGEAMVSSLSQGTLEIVAAAGHNLTLETPLGVAATLLRQVSR